VALVHPLASLLWLYARHRHAGSHPEAVPTGALRCLPGKMFGRDRSTLLRPQREDDAEEEPLR
jgi:hypothetical protein